MNQLVQEAVLVGLARRLRERGSWAGETHLQKAAYLLSELRGVDFDFDFILYKHGPFSFELRDELAYMRGEGLLESFVPDPRYGPQMLVTEDGEALEGHLKRMIERYGKSLDWVADTLGGRDVMDLERLATAMWMTRKEKGSVRERAEALVRVKPHISLDDAIASVEEMDRLQAESDASVAS
jgi:uncharacterized protein YwgA